MKHLKILYFFIGLLVFGKAFSQAGVTITPSAYTAIDEVTITVDLALLTNKNNVSETMASEIPYVWIFSNAGDAKTNDSWGNQGVAARMKLVSGTVWQFKFQPDTLFQKTPGELKTWGFLIKNQTGSKQTVDFNPPYKFDPLVFTERDVRMFPSRASQTDLVYLFFKNNLAASAATRRMTPVSITITAYDATGAVIGTSITDRALKTNAAGEKYYAFHPQSALAIPANKKVKEIRFMFKGTDIGTTGGVVSVSSELYTQELYNAK